MAFLSARGDHRLLSIGSWVSICWCCLAVLIFYLLPGPFKTLNNRIYDLKLSLVAEAKLNPDIVHVDVDDQAVKKYGQWPWDRGMSARIVRRLTELGAKVIVFDLMYASEGRSKEGDEALVKSVVDSGRVVAALGLVELPPWVRNSEAVHDTTKEDSLYRRAWRFQPWSGSGLGQITNPSDSCLPLSPIIDTVGGFGHINATPDSDGIHRRVPLLLKFRDRLVPSLSFAALTSYLDVSPEEIVLSPEGRIEIHHPKGVTRIPVDAQGNLLINWRPVWDSFENYTVLDLLDEPTDPLIAQRYKDKIAIVAISWSGTADMGANPLENTILLSRVHSSALDTMLTGRFVRELPPFPLVVAVSIAVLILFFHAAVRTRLQYAVTLYLAVCAVFGALVIGAFCFLSLEVPSVEPFFIFLPSAAVFLVFRAVSTEKERHEIREIFGQYLSDDVVKELLESPGNINLEGELKEISVLVSDLRGFSAMVEAMEPRVVLRALNRYFERMANIIMRHGGTIDEFMGDGILVFFGAPRPMPDHPTRAVACAVEMQESMPQLNQENLALGLPELQMGIGINCGRLLVGNIGSEKRKKYGALGSAINLAFRVESQTTGGEILITEALYERMAQEVETGVPRKARLKGLAELITLYPVKEFIDTNS